MISAGVEHTDAHDNLLSKLNYLHICNLILMQILKNIFGWLVGCFLGDYTLAVFKKIP